jgi:hypothetical protein
MINIGGIMQGLKRLISACLCLLLISSFMPFTASAQSAPTGSGLSISPTIYQFTVKPGQTQSMQLTIKNTTTGDITAAGEVDDFVANGTSGSPRIVTPPTPQTPNSIKSFVGTLYNIPLSPNQQKTISVNILIPNSTPAGAYYGVLRYKSLPAGVSPENAGKISLTASVATVVLITVPGNIRQLVKVDALHIYSGNHDGRLFFSKPDKIGVEINNLGNGFAQPFGTVEIQNMFRKEVDTFQFNNPQQLGNVLPNSIRIFTKPIHGISQIGRYTVTANVAYGNGSNVLTIQKTFWYIPSWLAYTVLAILLILVLLTIRLYVRYRRDAKRSYKR